MLNVALRSRLVALGSGLIAVWLAWLLAHGSYALPGIVAGGALLGIGAVYLRVSYAAIVLGAVVFGYIVGNRGFAQIMPVPWLPILPAEGALILAGGWMLVQCAFAQELPVRRDALNTFVVAWLVVGTARVALDVRVFGALAIRDYAMVYYAAFFFLAQHLAADASAWRLLRRAFIAAAIAQPIAFILSEAFPEFFLSQFVIRGVPVIYFKGDLALTFMALGAFILAFATPTSWRRWTWPVASLQLLFVMGSANRASMLGVAAALAWLSLSKARRFVWLQLAVLACAFCLLATAALLVRNRTAEAKLDGIVERVVSLGDVFGTGTYSSDESSMKGDNNRFRSIWWRTVILETLDANPAFGLGFGHDLSRAFLQHYNPEMAEDFTARSPHSIIVSAIGRMGFVGGIVFVGFMGAFAWRTWRGLGGMPDDNPLLGFWTGAWVILISACFGVVLEGPMGAVVFWTAVGLAHAAEQEISAAPMAKTDPHLRGQAAADQLASAS